MLLLIDNYDSFTYNIYQYLSELTQDQITVIRNDKITIEEIENSPLKGVIISPGPGRPEEAGITVDLIRHCAGRIPILGICLGHQAIGCAFGGKIIGAKRIVHGKAENIHLDGRGLFRSIPSPALFTRYHSLVIDPGSVPEDLEVTALSLDREIMGVRHKRYPIEGIQFHPESVASEYGKKILKNFLEYRREPFLAKEILVKVLNGEHLTRPEAEGFMDELTEGNLSLSQTAAYLA
ncbi:MAG: gamma-glutamyl-gamma-aminobutyrate hydrolase family protein, partial [Spirochaetota bacterium]